MRTREFLNTTEGFTEIIESEMVFIKDCWLELFYYCVFYIVLCIVLSILFIKSKKDK